MPADLRQHFFQSMNNFSLWLLVSESKIFLIVSVKVNGVDNECVLM